MGTQTFYADGTVITEWDPIEVAHENAVARVNAMRDALIDGGFWFTLDDDTHRIQSRQSDRENVLGLSIAASGAIAAGAQPNDLEWLIPGQPFGFITADNTIVPLDAFGVISLYQQALAFKSGVTLYARALKNAVLACKTDEEVSAINLVEGWPGGQ